MKTKLILFLCFWVSLSFGQETVNIPVSGNASQVRVVNLREQGVMVLDKVSDGELNIHKLDNDLNVIWKNQVQIPNKASFIDEYYDGKFLYIILEPKSGRSFTILKISTAFSAYQKYEFPLTNKFQYGFFAANDQVICIGGSVKNEPFVAIMETTGGAAPKFVSGNGKGTVELEGIHVTEESVFATFINTHKKLSQIVVREYDFKGGVVSNKNLVAETNNTFLSARYFESGGRRLLAGNYGLGKTPSDGFQSTQGIFLTDIDTEKTKYYSFANFKNIFGFMSERQKGRLERQVEKKKKGGKEYNFNYRLFISGLEFNNNQTLIVGEVFQPEFVNRNFYGYGMSPFSTYYWGRPMMYNYYWLNRSFYGYNYRNNQVFDGFRYLEGVIFAIDENGDFKWDASFQYKNQKSYDLVPHLKVSEVGDNNIAMYTYGSKLKIADVAANGNVLNTREFNSESLELQNKNRKAEFNNFSHWYDNVYYNWGVAKSNSVNNCFIQKIIP